MPYYAHSNEDREENWQLLSDHLLNTSCIALKFGNEFKLGEIAEIAAKFHDIGKYSLAFQQRLKGSNIRVDHASAGAQEAIKLFDSNDVEKAIATIIAYCVIGHHSGLPDYGSDLDISTEGTLKARLKKELEDYQAYTKEIELSQPKLPKSLSINPITNDPGFSLSFLTRMVYSILVDADYLDTENFMRDQNVFRGGHIGVPELNALLNKFLTCFDQPESPINVQRTNTLRTCIDTAREKPGLFRLTVPTGGGKTLSSLAFALNHAAIHNLKRIIYVIPYTSIIDQNAQVFKSCLGESNVLEHHSNFDWKIKQADNEFEYTGRITHKLKLASENWDIPVIATTNVQFFESLFSNRSSQARKIHNIANSVIIFDEAQMLPKDYLKPCMYAIGELVTNYNSTVVFCTATQPQLEQFLPKGSNIREIIPDPNSLYRFYKRVQVKHLGKVEDVNLADKVNAEQQALAIVNTRKHAKGLFSMLRGDGGFHLSTLMCPAHRKQTITTITQRLEFGLPCRVISTQIMEAGIDVDFPVGYRALAGLDSIVQAAGRINREAKRSKATLYTFEPDTTFIKRLPAYLRLTAEITRTILRDFDDPVSLEAIQRYYDLLYDLQDTRSFDSKDILAIFDLNNSRELRFAFKTAAEKFKIIESNTVSVVIKYDADAIRLLEQARYDDNPHRYSRALQMYTVNIYENEFLMLQNNGYIDFYNDIYAVLNKESLYTNDTGLIIPQIESGEGVFF